VAYRVRRVVAKDMAMELAVHLVPQFPALAIGQVDMLLCGQLVDEVLVAITRLDGNLVVEAAHYVAGWYVRVRALVNRVDGRTMCAICPRVAGQVVMPWPI
jgi:hypothetical protein